jgi:hypothetical protein
MRGGTSIATTFDMKHPRTETRKMGNAPSRIICLGAVLLGSAIAQQTPNSQADPFEPDTPGAAHAATDLRVSGDDTAGWLYPITKLDEYLPRWIQFGGQFRDRVESQDGLGYARINDVYDLTQFRIGMYIRL